MKKILAFSILMVFLSTAFAKGQMTIHKMLHAGYVYQNQSFGEIGGRLLFLNNDDVIYRMGAAAMMGSVNKEFAILPKLQGDILINFERNVDLYHSYYFLAGAEITTKYVAPKIGASLFGLLDLTAGYGFSLDKNGINGKELKGLNLNFTLNLPLVMLNDLLK
ncbi:hypothetical protein H0S70_12210 [Chryseobacterium manosquense]|uniref:Outer membrane protein beta-barrel domain-containing protein n=1 Tax=Chryseobacterium manosquense TaxID=2754694 RepID=A0A7H1DVT2_9FLAO|nr:hypothetical protein [Chryseobacterium manosquense]QNS41090.1 hypothetical protein H0S70_12210 [Chryseobacterium manosquense]